MAIGRASVSCRLTRRLGPSGVGPGQPLPGLRSDLPGGLEQFGQVVDRAVQPSPARPAAAWRLPGRRQVSGPGVRTAQRACGVGQQPLCVRGGLLREPGEFPGDPPHRGLCLLAALAARGCAASRRWSARAPRPPGSVAHPVRVPPPAAWIAARSPRSDDRLRQQPRIGRVGTLPGPQWCRARSLVVRSSFASVALASSVSLKPATAAGPQRVVSFISVVGCGTVAVERDPAEPSPHDRVADLRAQGLVAQPVAELQEHQSQIRLHRRRRTADPRVEVRRERREERRVVQQRVDPRQLAGSRSNSVGRMDSHSDS